MTSSRAASLRFGALDISYDDGVLEPRPWTALQSEWAAELLADAPPGPVLELCTGAGHIGLLAATLSGRSLVAVDLDPHACDLARANAAAGGLADVVEVRQGRLQEVVGPDETFPLVVADPPWVTSAEVGRFPEDPLLAIDGGADGLDLAWACVAVAERHLVTGCDLLLQLGDDAQADEVAAGSGTRHRMTESGRRSAPDGLNGVVLRLTAP